MNEDERLQLIQALYNLFYYGINDECVISEEADRELAGILGGALFK